MAKTPTPSAKTDTPLTPDTTADDAAASHATATGGTLLPAPDSPDELPLAAALNGADALRVAVAAHLDDLIADLATRGTDLSLPGPGFAEDVIGWRLTDTTLTVVTSAGRKIALDRRTGAVTDLATGAEITDWKAL